MTVTQVFDDSDVMGERKQCRKDIGEKTDLSMDKGRVTLNTICDASDLFSDSTIFSKL